MYCNYCGRPNPDDAHFCSACGRSIMRTSVVGNDTPPSDHASPAERRDCVSEQTSSEQTVGSDARAEHQTDAPAATAPEVSPTPSAVVASERRLRIAGVLLLLNGAVFLSFPLIVGLTVPVVPHLPNQNGMLVWDLIVSLALIGGKWRRFALFRVYASILWIALILLNRLDFVGVSLALFHALLVFGFCLLLHSKGALPRRRVWIGVVCVIIAIAAKTFVPSIPELQARARISTWALDDRVFSDADNGIQITLPKGWRMLKRDNPIIPGGNARMIAANLGAGAFAMLIVEELPTGVQSLDHYLDLVFQAKHADLPDLVQIRRESAAMCGVQARRSVITWSQGTDKYSGWLTACRDGWRYVLLTGWSIAEVADTAGQSVDTLSKAVENTQRYAVKFAANIRKKQPWMSEANAAHIAKFVVEQGMDLQQMSEFMGKLDHQTFEALEATEQQELSALQQAAISALPANRSSRVKAIAGRIASGASITVEERIELVRLLAEGRELLGPDSRTRIEYLQNKGLTNALSKQSLSEQAPIPKV